jgi:hypothetical protein
LAGIIGVPWQDIADDQSLAGPGLRYLTAGQLSERGRWDVILGDPSADPPVPPSDPFMLETPRDRTGLAVPQQNPIAPDEKLVGAESPDPRANAINGHEQRDVNAQDLQYACTFPLDTPRTCDQAVFDTDSGCDCFAEDLVFNRGLCQPPGGGQAGIVQRYAKAYPGLRHLQVLKEVGDSGIVASICPKVLDKESSDYGYNPAVDALITRMTDNVFRRCLQHPLPLSTDGRVPCRVVQVFAPPAAGCGCDALGMTALGPSDATLARAVQNKLVQSSQCAGSDPDCSTLCRCELPQLEAADLEACQSSVDARNLSGFCYISATQGEPNVGNPQLVADCSRPSLRDLRILGGASPSQVVTLLACPTGS